MNSFLQILAIILLSISAVAGITFFLRPKWPSPVLWFVKLYTSALSHLIAFVCVLCTIVALAAGSLIVGLTGIYITLVYLIHIFLVSRPPGLSTGFETAFGLHWENRMDPSLKTHFLRNRVFLKLPRVPEPRLEQNIPFATIPGTSRQLLCDIWQPASSSGTSGLAFIYMHGSAFYFLDKDFGTRHMFRYLAAQGHVIMDVAYRLFPETDIMGMVNDVKRAIAWMKENAGKYGIDPGRIAVGGGSAGAHLALMTAFTSNDPQFSPVDLQGKDLSVCAAISLYGANDLKSLYYHTNQHLTTRPVPGLPQITVPTKMPKWIIKAMGGNYHRLGFDKGLENVGTLPPLIGGHPDECPDRYAYFSPGSHVHPGCPPTLLVHGQDDIMAPVSSIIELYYRLVAEKNAAVLHLLPQTNHGFDLIMPQISPSAHNALYDLERFLSLHVKERERVLNAEVLKLEEKNV